MRGTYSVTGYTLYFDWPRSWALVRIDRLIWDHASWRDSSRMLLYGYVKNNTSREYFVVFEHAEGE